MDTLPDLQFNETECSIILACHEPLHSRILGANPHSWELEPLKPSKECPKGERIKKEQATEGHADDFVDEDHASFTSTSSSSAMHYLAIPNPTYPRTRIRFGSARKADFHLPEEYGVSDYHFDIYINKQPAWMMNIRRTTHVNDEKLRQDQVAMHPEESTVIRIRSLVIYIFLVNDVLSSGWHIDANATNYPQSSKSQTQTSSSTNNSTISHGTGQQLQRQTTRYHLLRHELQTASSRSKIQVAIYKKTGERAIAKSFNSKTGSATNWVFHTLFGILKEEGFLLPLREFLYSDHSTVILSEYFDGRTLGDIFHPDLDEPDLDVLEFLHIYAQLGACALEWLRRQGIIHRNIRPSVILVQTAGRVTARLTGFSECCKESVAQGLPGQENDPWVSLSQKYRAPEMLGVENYSHPVDMYSLSAIMDEALSCHPSLLARGSHVRDLVDCGLDQNPGSRLTPLSLRQTLEQTMGSLEPRWPLFRSVHAVKAFVLDCNRSRGIDHVSVKSLQEVLNALRHSEDKAAMASEMRWAYAYGREYMKLQSAIKYCHQDGLTTLEQSLMEKLDTEDLDGSFQIIHGVDIHVHYHAPSLMVNITHLLSVVGDDTFANLDYMTELEPLKVLGTWKGEYVTYVTFQRLFDDLSKRYPVRLCSRFYQIPNPMLGQRISAIDSFRYSLLTVDQLHPHTILMRNWDSKIHLDQLLGKPSAWEHSYDNSQFVSVADAWKACAGAGMNRALLTLDQSSFDGTNASPLQCTDEDDGTVTSLCTSPSVRKDETEQRERRELKFRWRSRRREEPSISLDDRIEKWFRESIFGYSLEVHSHTRLGSP